MPLPIIGDLVKGIFGEKGLAGGVVDVLKSAGVLKDAEAELKATQALMTYELRSRAVEAQMIESVNATMRVEAQSGDPWQRRWRPALGYTLCLYFLNNVVLLPYFAPLGLKPIELSPEAWYAILSILGISALTRGGEKIVRTMRNGGKTGT